MTRLFIPILFIPICCAYWTRLSRFSSRYIPTFDRRQLWDRYAIRLPSIRNVHFTSSRVAPIKNTQATCHFNSPLPKEVPLSPVVFYTTLVHTLVLHEDPRLFQSFTSPHLTHKSTIFAVIVHYPNPTVVHNNTLFIPLLTQYIIIIISTYSHSECGSLGPPCPYSSPHFLALESDFSCYRFQCYVWECQGLATIA
jgi:hypothetical protein